MSETSVSADHAPDPEFVRQLEWQLRTEQRRSARFGEREDGPRRARRLASMAAVALIALALGAGSVVAAQEWQRSREAELLLASARLKQEIAAVRLATLHDERLQEERRFEVGFTTSGALGECVVREAQAGSELACRELNAAEIAASRRALDDRISAPRIAGRDFVRERFESRRDAASAANEQAAERASHAEAQFQNGMLPRSGVELHQAVARAAAREVERITRLVELRGAFLAGTIDAARAELAAERIGAESALAGAQDALASATTAAAIVGKQATFGLAGSTEQRNADAEMARARAAVEIAKVELALIDERMKD